MKNHLKSDILFLVLNLGESLLGCMHLCIISLNPAETLLSYDHVETLLSIDI